MNAKISIFINYFRNRANNTNANFYNLRLNVSIYRHPTQRIVSITIALIQFGTSQDNTLDFIGISIFLRYLIISDLSLSVLYLRAVRPLKFVILISAPTPPAVRGDTTQASKFFILE